MLLKDIISKGSMHQAYERVVANEGMAGIDGMGFLDFSVEVMAKWPLIKSQLETGDYRPMAVNG